MLCLAVRYSDCLCTPQITRGGWFLPCDLASISQARLNNAAFFGMDGYRKDFCSDVCKPGCLDDVFCVSLLE